MCLRKQVGLSLDKLFVKVLLKWLKVLPATVTKSCFELLCRHRKASPFYQPFYLQNPDLYISWSLGFKDQGEIFARCLEDINRSLDSAM